MRLLSAGALALMFATTAAAEPTATCDDMVGVWEYVAPSAPGHAIIARQGKKYLGIFVNTLAEPYSEQPTALTTPPEKRGRPDAYSAAGAWEHACEAKAGMLHLTLHWLYSSYRPQDLEPRSSSRSS